MADPIDILSLPHTTAVNLTANVVIQEAESNSPTSRTSIQVLKDKMKGAIFQNNEGFVEGGEVYKALQDTSKVIDALDFDSISNLKDVPTFTSSLNELFRTDLKDVNLLQYNCCLIPATVNDFPEELKETDNYAFVYTNRNEVNGIQILIGVDSGIQFTRRMYGKIISDWTSYGGGINYATFEIDPNTGNLIMYTPPGYRGTAFKIENGQLVVYI